MRMEEVGVRGGGGELMEGVGRVYSMKGMGRKLLVLVWYRPTSTKLEWCILIKQFIIWFNNLQELFEPQYLVAHTLPGGIPYSYIAIHNYTHPCLIHSDTIECIDIIVALEL